MTPARMQELTAVALDVAEEAAALVLSVHRTDVAPTEKGRADLVTEYDLKSERLIRKRLAERTPELRVVGEEEGGEAVGATWYCDPIDGTTNFVHGHPFFCVSIGLLEDGEPLLGAVVAPALSLRWHGFVGGGAFRNGKPCRVSATQVLGNALIATGFHPAWVGRPEYDNVASFMRTLPIVRGIRRCGSAALDLCMVADGTYDAYWERGLNAWDVAAGAALVCAAGGRLSDLRGRRADLARGHILASNGRVHDGLLSLLPENGTG
jgi:myo-inositol-1(or 4)-monophosphatase